MITGHKTRDTYTTPYMYSTTQNMGWTNSFDWIWTSLFKFGSDFVDSH